MNKNNLKDYRSIRDFKKSLEPRGKVLAKNKKLFVIQKHDARHLHYDLRLELHGVLLSWAIPKGPSLDPGIKRLAVHVEDHPLAYADFEGVIPKGQYGAGTVTIWDKGKWLPEDKNPYEAYINGHMNFSLKGKKLNGHWKLIRLQDDKAWLLIKSNDEFARPGKKFDITREDKTISLKRSSFPLKISPQLATLVDAPPKGRDWFHEIKLDGYRVLAYKKNGKTTLFSRNGKNWTNSFKRLAKTINDLSIPNAIFDGEVVVLDEHNHSDFQLLQNSIKTHDDSDCIYYIFDLLYYDQSNLMKSPLVDRKKKLQCISTLFDTALLRYNDHIEGAGKKVFGQACKMGLEGIISKEKNSSYEQKRSKSWLKIKCIKRQEFVIGGYTPPHGSRKHFGSLLVGAINNLRKLDYHGRVGTGFTEASLNEIYTLLHKLQSSKCPFAKRPPDSKKALWVKPVLVAEVEFIEWTQDDILRHPSFKGLRMDKSANQIYKEDELQAVDEIANIQLTHPDKIYYKEDGITKKQIFDYYKKVSPYILPFIVNRPISIVRCPNQYNECFYQKSQARQKLSPHLYSIKLQEKNKNKEYIYIKDEAGLLALSQINVLEIHPWGSKIDSLDYPDTLTFDLDPAPDVSWKKIVETAFVFKKELASLKLKSYVKTTGGKGLHIVVPILPEFEWSEAKHFAKSLCEYIASKNPERYTLNMNKAKRKGKIYLDYLRNQKGATAIAPYSTRARIHAPIAAPIGWNELTNNIKDIQITIKTMLIRLKKLTKDPWKDFFKNKQSLPLTKF